MSAALTLAHPCKHAPGHWSDIPLTPVTSLVLDCWQLLLVLGSEMEHFPPWDSQEDVPTTLTPASKPCQHRMVGGRAWWLWPPCKEKPRRGRSPRPAPQTQPWLRAMQ